MKKMNRISGIDLFCGSGGLTHGLKKHGIQIKAGIDIDHTCKFAFEANNSGAKFIEQDVNTLTIEQIKTLLSVSDYTLLAGCAPCQPFSSYAKGKDTTQDSKWSLLRSFASLVKKAQPDLVTMENVPQLPKHSIFKEFLSAFDGYETWFEIVNCVDYGVPQSRRRLVFLASKLGPINLIDPTHKNNHLTVLDAISHLPPIEAGGFCEQDPLHASAGLSDLNLRRIRQSKPGGSWQDWDASLIASCHKTEAGKSFKSVYGRMKWESPAPTMTTLCYGYGNGRFGHPEQDRAISLREAALLQTFPSDYQFLRPGEKVNFSAIGRHIGNAVPVRLGEAIAISLIKHVEKYS